jgi:predicted Zn-dependent protease
MLKTATALILIGFSSQMSPAPFFYSEQISSMLYKCNKQPSDPKVPSYIKDIANKLISVSGTKSKIYIKMTDNYQINAWACPNNVIVLTENLLLFAENNKDQLAGIIGHEISHITLGHNTKEVNTRQDELDADREGVHLANMAGYKGCEYTTYMYNLMSLFGDTHDGSHPPISERIMKLNCPK